MRGSRGSPEPRHDLPRKEFKSPDDLPLRKIAEEAGHLADSSKPAPHPERSKRILDPFLDNAATRQLWPTKWRRGKTLKLFGPDRRMIKIMRHQIS